MNLNQIEQTLQLLKAHGAKHLRYKDEDLELELDLNTAQIESDGTAQATSTPQPAQSQASEQTAANDNQEAKEVRSQMIGTFYLQDEKELTDPIIKVGDEVNEGDVIGYVEAMKVMNEVTADQSGKITEILVEHGENIEHNQPIIKLK
ncbi:acetyl-CoA carboxylase biotin carboxyl carrier protein [Staphylococcus massiliensis]|uniref:Acetyl-CoA carboxylase, biotin carboxyl carrier protein n=1 Tax=Staphylococcus massiliensis S46 TaxID=1229783 RepID=K9B560_9STAP|nr:biotin/lipoyl-containing protein [Staphylococcus massiliensis]EKU49942.1 acetyl-CoA carboxylase, biotin carboxyl carrier protein [Staphylococcus massiliensis S46]MCG3399046.1 acetyl-CoA carboxylase biotin carboxyl carrier protein subunit [Staphylococcus massiliensis]MCG3400956.1 acetyl-CoA carboxylase biotin carboxyl carrier protein subunit [Staphylococcus massiliensis]PNZ98941.1 acetyl-CoA carboxylase biotin carboxyl carrier protein subunit [Staphylococcus massiliensis CCUG 55927]